MDFGKTDIYTKVNGEKHYLELCPTVHLYGMYKPADESKTELTTEYLAVTSAVEATSMFYTTSDENFIEYHKKPKFTLKKLSFSFNGGAYNFTEENVQIQAQGDSSLNRPKKNLKLKFASSHNIPGLVKSKQYILKACYFDATQTQIGAWGNLWRDMMESRDDYDSLPDAIRNSSCKGAMHSLPVKVYYTFTDASGNETTDYLGTYLMTEKKGDVMAGFDTGKNPYAFMLSNVSSDGAGRSDYNSDAGLYGSPCPKAFNKHWNGKSDIYSNGFEFEDGGDDYVPEKVNLINNIIDIVQTPIDSDFKAQIVDYIDITGFIDYILFMFLTTNSDGFKNIMYYSTDYRTDKIHPMVYDFDNAKVSSSTEWGLPTLATANPIMQTCMWMTDNDLLARIMCCFGAEIRSRYTQLREHLFIPASLALYFCSEYERTMPLIQYNQYTMADDGTLVNIPVSVTNNALKFKPSAGGFPALSVNAPESLTKLTTTFKSRIDVIDAIINNYETYFPSALINRIDTENTDIITAESSINIFDYVKLFPICSEGYKIARVKDKIRIAVLNDPDSVINGTTTDGTINFTGNEGAVEIKLYVDQIGTNTVQSPERYAGYWGKVQSPLITIHRRSAAATSVSISIINGVPYQYGKTVILEAIPNGSYDSVEWSVTPSTSVYRTNGRRLYIETNPYEETYSISCTAGTASATYDFTTVLPKKLLLTSTTSVKCNDVVNLNFENTVFEGEYTLENIGYPCQKCNYKKIAQFIFNTNNSVTLTKLLTDKCSAFALMYRTRQFKDDYYITLQVIYGNKSTTPISTDAASGSAGIMDGSRIAPTAFVLNPPITIKLRKSFYFKICADYVQIDEVKYPYTVEYAKNTSFSSTQYPLRLFGEQRTTNEYVGVAASKESLYYLNIYENGVLTHHIVPTTMDTLQNDKKYITDEQDTDATFTSKVESGSSSNPFNMFSVDGFGGPRKDGFTVTEYLPNNDSTCVPFMGSTFVNTGILPDIDFRYEIKFRPMFDGVVGSSNTTMDSRGTLFGSSIYDVPDSTVMPNMAVMMYTNKYMVYHNSAQTKTNIEFIRDTVYTAVLEGNKLTVYNDSHEVVGEETVTRATPHTGVGTIFLGANGIMEYNSYSNTYYSTAISGFYGYIYGFKITRGEDTVIDLTPNTMRSGFMDSVSGKEYLVYTCGAAHTTEAVVNIDIADDTEISGKTLQLSLTADSVNTVVSTGARRAQCSNAVTNIPIYGYNSTAVTSQFVWEIPNEDDRQFAEIDKDTGKLTILKSATSRRIEVKCYWSVDPRVCSARSIVLSYV